MIASSVFGLVYGWIVIDLSQLEVSHASWFWLVLLVVFSTVIPSFMMTEAINRIGPAQTGVVGMIGPIFTIILAVYLLNEPFTLIIAIGVIFVLLGVMSLVLNKPLKAKH